LRVVTSGLAAGDVVIVNGVQRVRPGVNVAETRVAMGHDLPALARTADAAAAANAPL
jgi:multidrug efflux system membrane fusion protein